MRKLLPIALLTVACLLALAGPAFAQRDPFDPVIDTTTSSTGSTGTTTTVTNGSSDGGAFLGIETLANTGADMTPWLALAYGLLVLGGGALVLVRTYQGQPIRR